MAEDVQTTPTKERTRIPSVTPEGTGGERTRDAPLSVRIERETSSSSLSEASEDPSSSRNKEEANAAALALMMFSPRAATELPALRTADWPYEGQKPNPISISKARKLLAAAYAAVPCELKGAGVHGHAWIIETKEQWTTRSGASMIAMPTKPEKETDYDVKKQLQYADNMETYRLYNHLMQEQDHHPQAFCKI